MSNLWDLDRDQLMELAEKEKVNVSKIWGKKQLIKAIEKSEGKEPSKPPIEEVAKLDEVKVAIQPFVDAGLKVIELNDEYFHFRNGIKECAGNLKQPIKQIVLQARLLMGAAVLPTEE